MKQTILRAVSWLSVVTAAAIALPAAAAWSDVPTSVTTSSCPSSVLGCNTPINVSTTTQVKQGPLGVNTTSVPANTSLYIGTSLYNDRAFVAETAGAGFGASLIYPQGTRTFSFVMNSNNGYSLLMHSMGNNQIAFARTDWYSALGMSGPVQTGEQIFSFVSSGQSNFSSSAGTQYPVTALESRVDGSTYTSGSVVVVPQSIELSDRVMSVRKTDDYGHGQVGIGLGLTASTTSALTVKPNSSLVLAVGGKVGALAYCDLSGNNCLSNTGNTNYWALNSSNNTISNISSVLGVKISSAYNSTSNSSGILRVTDNTYGNYGALAINGNGAEFYGLSAGVYAHAPGSTANNTALVGMMEDGSATETYGAKLISGNFGAFLKGRVALYATDMSHTAALTNRAPSSLVNGSKQWAGYFDGDVNINGNIYINETKVPTAVSIVTSNTKVYSSSRWIKVEAYCPSGAQRTGCSSYQSDCEESDCGNHGVKPVTSGSLQGCQGWFDNDSSVEDRVDAYCLQ